VDRSARVEVDLHLRLEDRFTREHGTIYLTGIQALVRVLLDRARLDRRAGRNTATYISGYEGSPLGGLDLEIARHSGLLRPLGIHHEPGLNEELAATAVAGTQLARAVAGLRPDGITGFWYGKAPGLDRATDAFRHANMTGTDPTGGAVAFVGDDPAAKSSSIPCSSEMALADLNMPTLVPVDPADILDLGRHAVELSRASGLWTSLRVATVVADGSSTATLAPGWTGPDLTDLSGLPAYSHRPSAHLLGRTLAELERSFHEERLVLALEYVRRSGINRIEGTGSARVGIVAAGPTYLVVRQALEVVGLGPDELVARGIRLLKLGAVHPLEPTVVRTFAEGLSRVLVIEDKRDFLESAIKSALYGMASPPGVDGKHSMDGRRLLSPLGELDVAAVARALSCWLPAVGVQDIADFTRRTGRRSLPLAVSTPRTPFFCSGCPHNSSTEVAPGTLVGAGIGCHTMLLLMPDTERTGDITGIAQMGGEGAHWIGMTPFVEQKHLVQNLGDGTFAHSGSLAIRAAVAAGANITFKLLRNSAVAMTGGQQPVGGLTLKQVIGLLEAEGVRRIIVTTDDRERTRRQVGRLAEVRHRDDLIKVQRELAGIEGVTVLIHDQECAAELRRKRRRGMAQRPAVRAFINQRVCEGCGDCAVKSNCLSVQPVETPYGRKTEINQSSCNLDFSCLDGDCPSFLAIKPGTRALAAVPDITPPAEPDRSVDDDDFRMRITGIGGTGVVTMAQILATAASTEGRFVRALDQTGLAQKGGPVVSDIRITARPDSRGPKLGPGECDLYLGCDILVATDPQNLSVCDPARTTAIVSSAEVPTGQMVIDTTTIFPSVHQTAAALSLVSQQTHLVDAARLSANELGSEQYANIVLLGIAYQRGVLPVTATAIEATIRLNATAIDANIAAFRLGRHCASGDTATGQADAEQAPTDLDALIAHRTAELRAYQNRGYAQRYRRFVERVRADEVARTGEKQLTEAVARNLFKLMAYKDEYEVARLSLDPKLTAAVEAEFGAGARFKYRLHPPALRALGMKRKISLGAWFRPIFAFLVLLRFLRGTPFDIFGHAKVRRVERALIEEYRAVVDELLEGLTPLRKELAVEIANLPDLVRGYEDIKLRNVVLYRDRVATLITKYCGREESVSTAALG
jgi:indolepyruvate ferredoxin oxidoreductase